jgi:hypothetical protein
MASKEYQHDVPPEWSEPGTGPGRFWGVWNLARAVRTVHVSAEAGIGAGRIARRWAKAQRRVHQTWKPRVDQTTGRVYYRRSRSRVRLMTNGNRGWIALNHGPAFASALSRLTTVSLELRRSGDGSDTRPSLLPRADETEALLD